MLHKNASVSDIHYMQNWQVSDSAGRVALSTSISSNDIGKVAFQTDNKSFYILQDTTGTGQWLAMGGGAGGGGPAISGGTNSQSTGTVNFSNANGISFGLNTNGVMTASVGAGGAAGSISAGTTNVGLGQMVMSNSNNITFGLNGSTLTASASFAQTVDTNKAGTGFTSAGAGIGLSGTLNTNGLSLSATVPAQTVQTQGSVAINGSTGAISFVNANNITFGNNASTITASASFNQTVQTQSLVQQVIAGTQTKTSGSLSFADSNGISFGMSGTNTITASYTVPSTAGLISRINVSAGTTSNNLSAMTFSNANNVSFGLNGSTVTASASFNQTAQTGISGVALSNTTYTSGTISFRDGNGVSFASTTGQGLSLTHDLQFTSNTSNITALAFPSAQTTKFAGTGTTTAGTNASLSMTLNSNGLNLAVSVNNAGAANAAAISLSGNSTSGGAGYSNITSGTAIFAGGNNITLSQDGSRITISGANVGGAQTGISAIIAGTQTITQGTLSFINSNGVSFGIGSGASTSQLTASVVGAAAQTGISSIVVSNTTYTSGQISFSQGNGISFASGAGQAVSITHDLQFTSNTSNITSNALNTSASRVINIVAATNNTGGGTASLSSNVSFSNANGITFYTSAGGAIVGSYTVPTQTVQPGIQSIAVSNTTYTTGQVSFSNANGMSFGSSAGGAITASYTVPTITNSSWSISDNATSGTVGRLAFTNLNGVTLSLSTGAGGSHTIVGSHNGLTTAALSNHSHGNPTLNLTNLSGTTASNSAGLTLSLSANAQSAMGFSGSNGSFTASTLTFGNLNGLSFYTSNGSIVGSYTDGGGGGGSINFSAGTTSGNLNSIVFSNSNGVSFGLNGSTITASAAGGGGAFSAGISTSGNTSGTTGLANAQLVFVGGNNITLSQSTGAGGSNTLVISAAQGGIAAGTQTAFTGTLIFSNSNNVSFGMSNNSVITASVNVANPAAISTWFNDFPASTGGSTLGAMGTSTASAMFIPFLVNQNIVFNCMKVLLSASYVSSTVTGSQTISSNWGIYSNNANTLSQISSGSYSFGVSCSSVSATFNYPVSTNSAGYTHTTLAQTATAQIHSNFGTVGYRNANLVFGNTMSLTPGVYWLGIHQRYSSTGFNAGLSNVILGNVVAPLASNGGYGFASSASTTGTGFGRPWIGFGPYTSTGSVGYSGTNIPISAFLSGIANTVSQMPFLTLIST